MAFSSLVTSLTIPSVVVVVVSCTLTLIVNVCHENIGCNRSELDGLLYNFSSSQQGNIGLEGRGAADRKTEENPRAFSGKHICEPSQAEVFAKADALRKGRELKEPSFLYASVVGNSITLLCRIIHTTSNHMI
jgi:hypothetical protein